MMYALALLAVLVESFLLGSIPCGVVVCKLLYGKDPRDGGSGSIGATNVSRQFGKKAGLLTFVGDVAKGALAVGIARLAAGLLGLAAGWEFDLLLVVAVFASIFGHMFTPWLHFKGGKGISTGLGSILVGFPPAALTILAVFIVGVAITRIVSVGSIAAATSFPIACCIFYWGSIPVIVFALLVAIGVDYAHRGNIKRLIEGTEPKFSFHKDE